MDQVYALFAIFGSIGFSCVLIARMAFSHEERKLKIKSQGQGPAGNEALRSQFEALRDEVARLRDTSTQYDVSIQHTLEDMQLRLARLESRRAAPPAANAALENLPETIGLRGT